METEGSQPSPVGLFGLWTYSDHLPETPNLSLERLYLEAGKTHRLLSMWSVIQVQTLETASLAPAKAVNKKQYCIPELG